MSGESVTACHEAFSKREKGGNNRAHFVLRFLWIACSVSFSSEDADPLLCSCTVHSRGLWMGWPGDLVLAGAFRRGSLAPGSNCSLVATRGGEGHADALGVGHQWISISGGVASMLAERSPGNPAGPEGRPTFTFGRSGWGALYGGGRGTVRLGGVPAPVSSARWRRSPRA